MNNRVAITCPKCGGELAGFVAISAAHALEERYVAPYFWAPEFPPGLAMTRRHRIEHVLNDRQDVADLRRGAVREARAEGGTVRKKHRFRCAPCRESLPVREERLWRALDRLADVGESSVNLDTLRRIVTLV